MNADFVASLNEPSSQLNPTDQKLTRGPFSISHNSQYFNPHYKHQELSQKSSISPLSRLLLVGGSLEMPPGSDHYPPMEMSNGFGSGNVGTSGSGISSSSSSSIRSSVGGSNVIGRASTIISDSFYQFQANDQRQETITTNDGIPIYLRQQSSNVQSFKDWWDEYWSRQPFPSGYTQSSITLLACFISTIIFLIVVGNLLVCIAIFTEKSLKSTQNWFIASLAVSDMLLGLVVMPFSLARELMGFWIFGPLWCDIHEAIDVLLTTASINTLCLISLDRYWSITQAVSYLKKRTPRRGAFMIAFVWFFSAAVSLPPLFGWKKQQTSITMINPNQTQLSDTRLSSLDEIPTSTTNTHDDSTAINDLDPKPEVRRREVVIADRKANNNININNNRDQLAIPILSAEQSNQVEQYLARNSVRSSRGLSSRFIDPDSDSSSSTSTNDNELPNGFNYDQSDNEPSSYSMNTPLYPIVSPKASAPMTNHPILPASSATNLATTEYPTCQLSDDIGYVLYSALGSFFIPCAVMVFTYIKIFLAARKRARRTINKPSRNKEHQQSNQRRHMTTSGSTFHRANQLPANSAPATRSVSGRLIVDPSSQLECQPDFDQLGPRFDKSKLAEPIIKGKIVIIERKKSVVATSLAPLGRQAEDNKLTSSSLSADKTKSLPEEVASSSNESKVTELDNFEQTSGISGTGCTSCTLTTSGAKLASPSVLAPKIDGQISARALEKNSNSNNNNNNNNANPDTDHNSNEINDFDSSSSVITVMKPSMDQVPVTRFNFQTNETEKLSSPTSRSDQDNKEAAALLKALTQIRSQKLDDSLISEVLSTGSGDKSPPESDVSIKNSKTIKRNDSVIHDGVVSSAKTTVSTATATATATTTATTATATPVTSTNHNIRTSGVDALAVGGNNMNSTNETCFMTIEEDSDMADTAGRTIMMVAGNSSQRHNNIISKGQCGMMMTMMPAADGTPQTTQANTCNNYACRRLKQGATHTRSGSSYCGSSLTINDDEVEGDDECIDDDDDEDDILSDEGECNGYSVSCGLDDIDYCPHCHECTEDHDEQPESSTTSYVQCNRNHSSLSDSPGTTGGNKYHHHHHHQAQAQPARHSNRCGADIETQSITGDYNQSLTEYRSNEDENETSSMIGLDVVEASPKTRKGPHNERNNSLEHGPKPVQTTGALAISSNVQNVQRKKSLMGIRLGGIVGAGLKANNNRQSTPTLQGPIIPPLPAGQQPPSLGTRNLKALRQNFFLKLNQLTAKSASKSENKKAKWASRPSWSGEQSTNYAPEPIETTIIDDCDAQTSDIHNSGVTKYSNDADVSIQPLGNSSDQTNESNEEPIRQSTGQAADLERHQRKSSAKPDPGQAVSQLNKRSIGAKSALISSSSANKSGQTTNDDSSQPNYLHGRQPAPIMASKKLFKLDANQPNRSPTIASSNYTALGSGSAGSKRAHLPSDTERHKRKLAKARERRATLILGLIMAAFITSWLPFFTFYVTRALCTPCRDYISPRFEAFIFWMGYCNSAINPIIYTIFNRDFRKAFRKILFRCL